MNLILNNLFNYTDNDGIFNYLNKYNVPWKQDLDIDILNLDYHSRYGIRVVSKQVTSLLNTDGLSSQNKDKLAKLIYSRNSIKWQKLWDSNALYDNFNPLDNTNWTEKTTIEKSGGDDTETNYGAVEETFEKGEQNNSNNNGAISNTTENRKSAFNSNSYQPDNSVKSDTTAQNNTSTDGARTDKDTTKARTDTSSIIYGSKEETTVHREGNIGITDTPTLIRNFRGLLSWQILDTIYEDINDVLVMSLFGDDDAKFDDYKIVTNYVLPVASADTLGGVKIGTNLHIDSNGVLSAEAEAGNVQSVNGKTGNVILTNIDVNAPSIEAFNNIATSKQDILTAGNNITIVDNVISASGGVIKPVILKKIQNCFISPQTDNTYFKIKGDTGNATEIAVFDVSNFVGYDYEFSALSKYWYNSDNASGPNRMRCAFVDDIIFNPDMEINSSTDILVTKEHGCSTGINVIEEKTDPWNVGNVKIQASGCSYGIYQNWGNTISGIIPEGAKYFLAYISNLLNDEKVRNALVYDFIIFK